MVAELDPPEPVGKSSALGTSQVWAWSHCISGEMRGVPTGTGYFTAGQSLLPSMLILKRYIKNNLLLLAIPKLFKQCSKRRSRQKALGQHPSRPQLCQYTTYRPKHSLTHSCRFCQCWRGRTQGCLRGLSSSRGEWSMCASSYASGWPVKKALKYTHISQQPPNSIDGRDRGEQTELIHRSCKDRKCFLTRCRTCSRA